MDMETRDPAALWAVFNLETGEIVERFGRHGSKASAQMMLEEFLDSFDVDVRASFAVRHQIRPEENE